jgi:hypothetical protein
MDFDTGTGGTGGSPPGSGGPPPPRVSGGPPGGEFNRQDPIQSFISTVQRVVMQPVDFYRGIQRQGDYLNPLIFAMICAVISAVLGGLIALVLRGRGFGSVLANVILAPIGAAIGLFIGAAIFYLLVMLIVGSSNSGFEATFRVVAYASVTSLVSWIPFVGGLIAFVWYVVLMILGIREVHTTTTGKAALVALIPTVVILLLALLLFSAILFAVFFGTQR